MQSISLSQDLAIAIVSSFKCTASITKVKTLINGNPDSMISLDSPKKKRSLSELKIKNIQSASTSSNLRRYSQDVKTKTAVSRFPMAERSRRPLIYQNGWTEDFEQ